MNWIDIFASVGTMVAGITILMELIDKAWHLDGVAAQARVLLFSIGVGIAGAAMQIGMFADLTFCTYSWWICGGVIGLASGVVACWSFSMDIVMAVLAMLKIRPPIKKKPQ